MQQFTSTPNDLNLKTAGFSLLELLISVALLGLVMSLIYGAFFQISNSSIKIQTTLQDRQELRLLMKTVLDDLQNIRYLKHFADSGQSTMQQRETGLIAERKLGPENPDSGELEEVSSIFFHTAVKNRFYPEEKARDPELHEVAYSLEMDSTAKSWEFYRREDFYLDNNLREGGISYALSESVIKFELEFLESETELAGGGFREKWSAEWNSEEKVCNIVKGNFCLPRAIKLTMALKGQDEKIVSDSQVINLCVPPCNPEIFE
ncbi:MAG: prepilin-type N-terminal cleavage/methylation domain-containing protein [SAR324 cluster bacterium]|nr:prepilin-type N-terminal cleavage/methylation domain-containing protein [SAR324 cluster bacterium]MBL7035642.1 prepilin-type N-terminal cleavage/methylation domain-containing protein [SAR324 cluster bacterium]